MRLSPDASNYTQEAFQADLSDLDAAIASGDATRLLAAGREIRSMSASAALTAAMRDQVSRRARELAVAQNSAVITA